jgi:hypothetical protein
VKNTENKLKEIKAMSGGTFSYVLNLLKHTDGNSRHKKL